MDQQQRIEELIDELYAVQKQAGDRMVELTNENKWILDKQERNVSKSIDDVRKYSKILVGATLAVCIVGGVVLGWLIYRWTEGVKRDVYWTYREVGKVIYKQEQLKNMLEGIKKEKKVKPEKESKEDEKNQKKLKIIK
jgi:hypothetical protein